MVLWNLKSVQFVYLQNFNTLCLVFLFLFFIIFWFIFYIYMF